MRIFLMMAAAFFASFGTAGHAAPPASQPAARELTADQWREDLRFMVAEMQMRHPNLYHHVSKPAFEKEVTDLDARIPSLRRNEIIVGMMRIAAMVGDGHTRIDPRKDAAFGFPSLPLKLYWFDDGLWVRAVKPANRNVLGAKVEAIGGVPIQEAMRRAAELASHENAIGPRLYVPLYLAMPDILQALGLSSSRTRARLTLLRDGRRWTEEISASEIAAPWPPDTDISLATPEGWLDARTGPQPLWLQAPLDYHRLIALPKSSALYAQLNMIAGTKEESLAGFGRRILEQAQATNPRSVILDLRLAYGGDGDLRNAFIPSLIRIEDADTHLFVLTARGTFSASQFLLDDLDRLTDATFVGESASSRPTGYGDGYRSIMPNSGLSIRTSIKYWQSGQDMREWTPIDLAPGYAFRDYVAGRDPALDEALAFTKSQLLEERLLVASRIGNEALSKVAADPVYRFADFERAGTSGAQRLLQDDKAAALRLARWTATRLPNSADAATVLAFVADRNGDSAEALRAARRTIEIDPDNRTVRSLLERLAK